MIPTPRACHIPFRNTDGLVLSEPWTEDTQHLIRKYLTGLDRFLEVCRQNDCKVVFVYVRAYPQVFDAVPAMQINHVLAAE